MKRTIVFVIIILINIKGFAYNVKVNGLYYNLNKENLTAEVTNEIDSIPFYRTTISGDVIIPSTVTIDSTNYIVNSIGNSAFRACPDLTSITIPNSVTSIGGSAFYN